MTNLIFGITATLNRISDVYTNLEDYNKEQLETEIYKELMGYVQQPDFDATELTFTVYQLQTQQREIVSRVTPLEETHRKETQAYAVVSRLGETVLEAIEQVTDTKKGSIYDLLCGYEDYLGDLGWEMNIEQARLLYVETWLGILNHHRQELDLGISIGVNDYKIIQNSPLLKAVDLQGVAGF